MGDCKRACVLGLGADPRLSRGLHVGYCSGLCEAVGNCSELVTVYPFLEKIRALSYSPRREGPQVGLIVLCLRAYVCAR